MRNEKNIGLDRIKLCNLFIKSVDIELIQARGGTVVIGETGLKTINKNTGEVIFMEDLTINIEGLGLSDNSYIAEIQINKKNAIKDWQVVAGVNIPKLYYTNNGINICDENELEGIPILLEKEFLKYGIEIEGIQNATVSSIEINYNIHDIQFYKTMKLINEAWKQAGHKVFVVDTKNGLESLKLKLPTREIKIYNKTQQLKDIGHIVPKDQDITRIEISTSHITTVKSVLDGNALIELIDNFEKLQKFYKDTIKKNIKKPFMDYCKSMENEMLEHLMSGVAPKDIINKIGLGKVVDLDIYANAIKKYYKKKYPKSSPSNVIKNNINKISNKEEFMGNIEKMKVFFEDIGV